MGKDVASRLPTDATVTVSDGRRGGGRRRRCRRRAVPEQHVIAEVETPGCSRAGTPQRRGHLRRTSLHRLVRIASNEGVCDSLPVEDTTRLV